jgi:type II secretory pathway predicted ATPase ExeA
MTDLIQEAFGLARQPFAKDIAADKLWLDTRRQSAIDRLIEAVKHRRHALVDGEPGVGKTCVLRSLRLGLSPAHYRLVYTVPVSLGLRDFYRQISAALGLPPRGTPAALFEAIQRECLSRHAEHHIHSVLVLDEAHLLQDSTLAHLHLLTNFEWDAAPLLSIVFVALPEFRDRLKLGVHRALLSRIHVHVAIDAGSPEETTQYVRARLDGAGARTEIVTPDGLALLHELSGGILRTVDILATAALRIAAAENKRLIDRQIVQRALQTTPLA